MSVLLMVFWYIISVLVEGNNYTPSSDAGNFVPVHVFIVGLVVTAVAFCLKGNDKCNAERNDKARRGKDLYENVPAEEPVMESPYAEMKIPFVETNADKIERTETSESEYVTMHPPSIKQHKLTS